MYEGERELLIRNVKHGDQEMEQFRGRPVLEQEEFRSAQIEKELRSAGVEVARLNAVVGRGGLLPPLASGTYEVNDAMLEELRLARRGEHASNLGAWLARSIAEKAGVPAYVVDPVSVDEWDDVARLSGTALLERQSLSHALNSKAVAKRFAREQGKAYESLRLIVAHLGAGFRCRRTKAGAWWM